MEKWKQVFDFPDYEISNLGQVRSNKGKVPKLLKQSHYKNGYTFVQLYNNGKTKRCLVHRLVMENFQPHANMKDLQVNHINCVRDDNRLENLEWTTKKENDAHRDNLNHTPKAQTIKVVFLDDRENMYFNSKEECAQYFGITRKAIDHYLQAETVRKDRKVQAYFFLVGNTYELNK